MAKQIVIQQNQEIEVTIPSGWVNRLKKEISRYGRKVRK